MRNIYLIIFLIVFNACELREIPIFSKADTIENSTIVAMDSVNKSLEFSLTTFTDFPNEIEGCSCYFSLTKNAFKDHQYIYSGLLLDSISYVKKEGNWVKLLQSQAKENNRDSVLIEAGNDSMWIEIKGKLDSSAYETRQYKANMKVLKFDKEVFSGEVFGECGC